jgi:hypothetical protein
MKRRPCLLTSLLFAAWLGGLPGARGESRLLDGRSYHLGTPGFPEWQEFEGRTPHGRRLDLQFNATNNPTEHTLLLRQRDVKQSWQVQLNGKRLGNLVAMETPLVHSLAVPPGALRDGENTLSIVPPNATDDIIVGEFKLDSVPLQQALRQATLEVQINDTDSKAGLPCRITIVDNHGDLAALARPSTNGPPLAVRPGVVYTGDGRIELGLLPGDYTVYASRGFEFGVSTQRVSVAAGEKKKVSLQIRREVPTGGWAACDTHIHTLTFSGHGDAALDERMLTIAGEGIEVAVATDHNHHTDYSEAALRMRLNSHFRSVIGNEVTTKNGHFNAFPIRPGSAVVDAKIEGWSALLKAARETPGVQVITLNHPRDLHSGFIPLGPTNFNAASGEHRRAADLNFDALEVITSAAMQSDIMLLVRDWFALLNRGHRLTAVGSSDTHDVSRFILGQGRTYVACNDGNPGNIDVDEVCRNLKAGRALVSLGLLANLTVNDRFKVGDLATNLSPEVRVTVAVTGPSWVTADRVELFADGMKIREQTVKPASVAEKLVVTWRLPRPAHDVYLVAIASGPGVTAPYWEIPRPYQPSSKAFTSRVFGATNPVWVDADGDGRFTSANGYARMLIAKHGPAPEKLLPTLAGYDEAVAAQAASLCESAGSDVRSAEFVRHLQAVSEATRRGFAAFAATLPAR